jgi:phospholipid-binding lipoprotein MlaA
MSVFKDITVTVVAGILLAGCASPRMVEGPQDTNDPFETVNRLSFNITLAFDKGIFRPTAIGYRRIVPTPVRNALRNFLNNLTSPVILANDVLQGETDRAGTTLARAGINTTIGIVGLIDVAQEWGYPRHSEDFGQTLGTYGSSEGPYLFVPLLGPSNPRDFLGWAVDFLFDPFTYAQFDNRYLWMGVRGGVDYVDLRERNIETLDDIERNSLDYYASVRSLYRQTRNNEIRNGAPQVEDLPDF